MKFLGVELLIASLPTPLVSEGLRGSPLAGSCLLSVFVVSSGVPYSKKSFRKAPSKLHPVPSNKHMKRCLISVIIGEMQVKTTGRYFLHPLGCLVSKKKKKRKQQVLARTWECGLVQLRGKTAWRFLKAGPCCPTLWYALKRPETESGGDIVHPWSERLCSQ